MKFRIIPIILCTALLLSIPVLADEMGEPIDGCTAVMAEGVTLREQNYWTGSDYRAEHYLTISPEANAVPTVVSSGTLWHSQSVAAAAEALEAKGMHVLAGSNGGYYTMATGEPVGLVISQGVLRADPAGLEAVGFRTDGSAVFGNPGLQLLLTAEGQTVPVSALNRAGGAGLRLYTEDCAEKIVPTGESWCVLCRADGNLTPGGSIELEVISIWETAEAVTVPQGEMLLMLDKMINGTGQELPECIKTGVTLALTAECSPVWENVDSAVCILYPLITDGQIPDGLETYAAPRTAIGIKADGSIILYTLDGRQSGYSTGAGLLGVARRMKELGCVTAGALDGGASTKMAAQMPGDEFLSIVNRPSASRNVVNYILVAVPSQHAGQAGRLTLYPLHINAVSGAEVPLTVRATDENGYPAVLPGKLSYTVSGEIGAVRDGVFYAEGNGSGYITVSCPGLADGEIPVRVTGTPEELMLYGEVYGKHTTALTLEPGQEVDLTVRARDRHVLLTGDDRLYTWTLDPAVGTVDETGHVIPGEVSSTGALTVSLGESKVEIPITVWSGVPFRDIARSDAYFDAVKYVYDNDIFEGTGDGCFTPEEIMSRGMLVTVLWRMSGRPVASTTAAFADVPTGEWYGPAVAWAVETGLVKGYSDVEFGPNDDLTREQILTILHRWAGLPEADIRFQPDLEDAGDYALEALRWALQVELIAAEPKTGLQPRGPMNRAAVAEVLMRWCLLSNVNE